ncbi:hypothetical protein MVEN_01338400 [Mycena venus]|uniref:DUF6534 domain-containing protein n=1 Tax=Mycena venus TaxID=2733690 RepID=A0A8H7CW40_9AGAR|nr:hypothetical protein MVEN_01338400 [Mycena venus]
MDPSFNPNTTIGAYQIGALVSYLLFGVTITQVYIYYSRFPDDSRKLKALVVFVSVCEAAHALCIGHTLYVFTISDYGHPERFLQISPQSVEAATFFTGCIGSCVQGFFAYRIYALSRKPYIPILSWGMSFLRLLGATASFATALKMDSVVSYEVQWDWLFLALWIVGIVNDLTITVTLVVFFLRQRRYAHNRTGAIVEKLIAWTIETGMMTSFSEIIPLICFVTMERNFIWLALTIVSAPLFSNSLLTSLNSRVTLRAMNNNSLAFSLPAIPSNSVYITTLPPTMSRTGAGLDAEVALGQGNKIASEE